MFVILPPWISGALGLCETRSGSTPPSIFIESENPAVAVCYFDVYQIVRILGPTLSAALTTISDAHTSKLTRLSKSGVNRVHIVGAVID